MKGRIHSIETCGTVDGPGIRFILFTQGCPLRCQYCHNPDTWKVNDGKEADTDSLIEEIVRYKSFMKFSGGGVTVSGGEPLIQPDFVKDLFMKCKDEGIHTCLDTSGFVSLSKADPVLDYTDLVLLDIKSFNPDVFKNVTGVPLDPTLAFAEHLASRSIPVWIRYVLVPGLTDDLADIENLAQYLSKLPNVERLDILPFHKMGEFKWEQLGYEYALHDVEEPTKELVQAAKEIFQKYNVPIRM